MNARQARLRVAVMVAVAMLLLVANAMGVELRPASLATSSTTPSANAVPAPLAALQKAICRVSAFGAGFRNMGTGVLLTSGCVLTASHTFAEGGAPAVTWHGVRTVGAKIVARDDKYDLVVLQPNSIPDDIPGAPPAGRNMAKGDQVYTVGFGGPDDAMRWTRRQVAGWQSPRDGGPPDWLKLSGPSRQGDSGGPIFTPAGEVIGVVWGTNGAVSSGTNTGRMQVLCQACTGPNCCPPGSLMRPRVLMPRGGLFGGRVRGGGLQGGMVGEPSGPFEVLPAPPSQPPTSVVPLPQPPPVPDPQPVPVPPPAPSGPTTAELAQQIDDGLAKLQKQIEALAREPGPKGEPGALGATGPPGKAGAKGETGAKGDAAQPVDTAAIVDQVIAKIDLTGLESNKELVLQVQRNTNEIAAIRKELELINQKTAANDAALREITLGLQATGGSLDTLATTVGQLTTTVAAGQKSVADVVQQLQQQNLRIQRLEQTTSKLSSGKLNFKMRVGEDGKLLGVEQVE